MKNNKLSFIYNKRSGVPLLRGRIYFLNLLMLPLYFYKYRLCKPDYLSMLTLSIFLLGIFLHTLACVVFHASSGNTFYRSVLRRFDYGTIFLINITNELPVFVHFIEKDKHVIMLVFHIIVNFCGLFSCLVMNFIFTNKSLRIFYFWIAHACCSFVPYKFYSNKMYLPLFIYILGYTMVLSGVLIYYLEKPNFVRGMFEYHELSHLLYTLTSVCLFMINGMGTGVLKTTLNYHI